MSFDLPEPSERVCTACRETKSLDEFSRAPRGKYGRKATCKSCDAARHARLHPPKPRVGKLRREPLPGSAEKRCTSCDETKTVDEFSLSRKATATSNAVYRSNCKQCSSDKAMQWYRDNPGRTAENKRRFNLKNLYGLTIAEYDKMVKEQNHSCAICHRSTEGRLHVDHDHVTGAVRGLLCNRCNRSIGLLGDDPVVMRRAITYLLRASRSRQEER